MGVFRFKKFEVVNERSAMKVNTDGVLLGAAMTVSKDDRRLLDVGTGTGTIALMAAQRLETAMGIALENQVAIDAIDIDEASAAEASLNFEVSPWSQALTAYNVSLDMFEAGLADERRYDHIFSNPPYFEASLNAPDLRRNTSRHTSTGLSYRDILNFATRHLAPEGRVSIILPAGQENDLCRYARMCGLFPFRIMRVRTIPRKVPSRIIAEFSFVRCPEPEQSLLTIQNEGHYTQEYLSLTEDFLNYFLC